jgi:hypothetical protein
MRKATNILCVHCNERPRREGKSCYHCKNYPEQVREADPIVKMYYRFLYMNAPPLEVEE